MLKIIALIIAVFVTGLSCEVYAQDTSARTQTLVAALDKTKYKKKENKYVSIEIYINIRNEPVVKSNPADFSGSYGTEDNGYRLDLKVAADGSATGSGYDTVNWEDKSSSKARFTLKDARVEGALLTGTKVFENGPSEAFEAVFANRTVSTGKNVDSITSRDTRFGLGFIQTHKDWTNRAFLVKND
jgi:hypothetical protein